MQKTFFGVFLLFCVASLRADVVTLPAAASIMGGSPFYSDARAFNTSYGSPLAVTATYRCFIATLACPVIAPQIHFLLAPRESKAFNDICAGAFGTPNTAGGVEFEFDGSEDQLVVTSRLYSTSPFDSVGMFIPGLDESRAAATTVLTSIRHDPGSSPPSGFRTNAGVFNPGSTAVSVTFTIFNAGAQVGVPVVRSVSGHSGVQVSGIFEMAGAAGLSTQNAVIVVSAATPVFSYAAVLDNVTTDPIFVVGGFDTAGFDFVPTPTPPLPTPTPTPPPSSTLIRQGVFANQNGYVTQGSVQIVRDATGAETVKLGSDFRVSSGAGSISLWLSKSSANVDPTSAENVKLGQLARFTGEATFAVPSPGSSPFTHVVTFCDVARVNFGNALLQNP